MVPMVGALRTQPFGQERFPRSTADGMVGSQVRAGPDCAGGPAREPDGHQQPTTPAGRQVAAEKFGHAVHAWSRDVGYQPGRSAESEFHQAAATSRASTGWKCTPVGTGITGSFAICVAVSSVRSWNWLARKVVHGSPDCSTTSSAARLDSK